MTALLSPVLELARLQNLQKQNIIKILKINYNLKPTCCHCHKLCRQQELQTLDSTCVAGHTDYFYFAAITNNNETQLIIIVNNINYLNQSRIIEHIFAPALNDRGVTGNITVGCENFQPIAS